MSVKAERETVTQKVLQKQDDDYCGHCLRHPSSCMAVCGHEYCGLAMPVCRSKESGISCSASPIEFGGCRKRLCSERCFDELYGCGYNHAFFYDPPAVDSYDEYQKVQHFFCSEKCRKMFLSHEHVSEEGSVYKKCRRRISLQKVQC